MSFPTLITVIAGIVTILTGIVAVIRWLFWRVRSPRRGTSGRTLSVEFSPPTRESSARTGLLRSVGRGMVRLAFVLGIFSGLCFLAVFFDFGGDLPIDYSSVATFCGVGCIIFFIVGMMLRAGSSKQGW